MADQIDIAQERHQLVLESQIASARPQPCGPSAFTCETCDASIPEARRALVHGVTRCVTCQEIHEAKALYADFAITTLTARRSVSAKAASRADAGEIIATMRASA
ncbi:TraR/DksA family transcriptional regulator [Serratia marcescens]|nr:TraR/DksA family transcriptional regulator [Serratia marcescens]